jgi:hypothetical protein
VNLTEPTTSLLYLARDFEKRYNARCRIIASVESTGYVTLSVEALRLGVWIEQPDAFFELPDSPERPSLVHT